MQPRLGFSEGTDYFNTGKWANWGTGIPLEVTPALMQRGEQRFNINCAVCHGPLAAGDGIVKHGLATVVSGCRTTARKMADGEIFNTITHSAKNTMMGLWTARHGTIASDHLLLRALQRSQHASATPMCQWNIRRIGEKAEPAKAAAPEKK